MNAYRNRVGHRTHCILLLSGLLYLLSGGFLSPAFAASSAAQWIEARVHSDGSLASTVEPASRFQATAEALLALDWQSSSAVIAPAVNYIASQPAQTAELLARQISISVKAGDTAEPLVAHLLTLQNPDGGFGEAIGYQSTAIDTALALDGLAVAGNRGTTPAARAIQYLVSVQSADGGYRSSGGEYGAVYITATVLRVLNRYRAEYSVSSAISKSISFVGTQQQTSGSWQSHWETASVLLALAPAGADATLIAAASGVLQAGQLADGSWDGSVYVTALAMQALKALDDVPPLQPVVEGAVNGRVLDASSGMPIIGATAQTTGGMRAVAGMDGSFSLTGLPVGSHTVEIAADGYGSVSTMVSVNAAGTAALGDILLMALPNTGFIRGVVTTAEDGSPVVGALVNVSGTSSDSTLTDHAGYFTLTVAPGTATVTVAAGGYEPVTATGTVTAGSSLWFAPALLAAGAQTPESSVSVQGRVLDDATGEPLDAVTISIVVSTGQWSVVTDASGYFKAEGIDAGEGTITITKSGYRSLVYTAMASAGNAVSLGTVRLPPEIVATSATVIGRVLDADSSFPVAGAEVRIQETGMGTVAGADGAYVIEGVALTRFTIQASAPGYAVSSGIVELAQYGTANVDIQIHRAPSADFDVLRVETDAPNYPALSKVNIVATLANTGVTARTVVLQVNVIDEAGTSVEQYPAVRIPMGGNLQDAWVTIDAGSERPVPLEWNTDRYGAGQYRLVIEAIEANTGRLLGQRAGVVTVDTTRRMGGSVAFEPPIAQLAAKQPIHVTALLSNQGNEPIGASTVTARVTLQREGYRPRADLVDVKVVASDPVLAGGRGMAAGPDGSFYVGDITTQKILRVLPTGTIETYAENVVSLVDLDVMQGKVYALCTNGTIEMFDGDGVRTSITTGLWNAQSLKVMSDGRMLIGVYSGSVYERATDGQLRKLSGVGLATPRGLVEAANGDLIIADSGQNALVRYADGKLTPFLAGFNQPYGLAADSGGNFYVTAFGANALYKVGADGQSTVLADGLGGPYDVKLRQDGTALVSNYNTNSIVAVAPDGGMTEIAGPTFSYPSAAAYDAAGTLYLANGSYSNIVSIAPDGKVAEFKSSVSSVKDMSVAADGGLALIQSFGALTQVSSQGSSRIVATGLSGAAAIAPSGDGGWFVAQTTGPRIAKISADGVVETHIARVMGTPRAVRALDGGGFYVLSSDGMLSHIAADQTAKIITSGLSSQYGLAIDAAGNIYTSETSLNRIVRITSAGEIERTSVPFSPGAIAFMPDGSLLAAQWNSGIIHRMDAGGTWSEFAQTDYTILYDMLADTYGTLWVPHYNHSRLTRFAPDGTKTVYTLPSFAPHSVTADGTGGVYVAAYGQISHVSNAGVTSSPLVHTVLSQYLTGVWREADGGFSTIDTQGKVTRFDAQGNLIGRYATLASPLGLANTKDGVLVAGSSMVLLFRDPNKLGEIVATGSYSRLAVEPAGTVLMATTANVSRLSADYTSTQSIATGYSNIQGLAVSPAGVIAIADYNSNRLAYRAENGELIDEYYGLVKPKGLLLDANGDVLVINGNPSGVMKIRDDGKLSMFNPISSAEQMLLESDGTILVGGSGFIRQLSATGTLLASHTTTALLGMVRANDGKIYTTSTNGRLFSIDGAWSERQVASGLFSPADIAVNSAGNVHVADTSRGVVNLLHGDGSLELAAAGLTQTRAVLFDATDALYAAYGTGQVAVFGADGRRTELPSLNGVGPFTALAVSSAGNIHALAPTQKALVQLMVAPTTGAQPGEVVYSASASISSLGLDGAAIPVDFGAWTPSYSGDYLVEIASADGATQGVLSNTLHVGPNAEAALALDRAKVLPGDREAAGQLTVIGADSTSITQIDPTGATLAASSYAYGRAIAADSKGNIYAADTNRIVKITPDGQISNFISGISVGNGMAVDSKDYLYIVSSGNVAKLSPDGTVFAQFTVPGTASAVAVGYDDTVYTVTSSNVLLRINQDGSYDTVASVGLSGPMGLTIDAYGYFYVLNNGNKIVRIAPDGSSTALYFDKASFEYEGVNVVADCSNNLLFAPVYLPPFKQSGEEDIIVQLVGDTGEVRQVLYGPSVDKTLTDIDVLFYDRFGKRLLMWGDVYGGKIFSFPLKCGGIDAEAHIVTRSDVDLSSTDPAPDQIFTRADGAMEYVWALEEVDNRGRTIALNMLFHEMAEGEERPMVQEAFLAYGNSFAPGEQVRVPISIPKLFASSQMTVTPLLSGDTFGPNATIPITIQVENGGEQPFDGSVLLTIVDSTERVVAELETIKITQLAGATTDDFVVEWNTGTTFTGPYSVSARLLNTAEVLVATGVTPFSIVADAAQGSTLVGAVVASDRAVYQAWDSASLAITVTNNGINTNAGPGTLELLVFDPHGIPVHTGSYAMPELLPGGRSSHVGHVALVDAPAGTYTASVTVRSAATGLELARTTTGFAVERSAAQALVGTVQVTNAQINPGEQNSCIETVNNRGLEVLTGITVLHRLVNLDTGIVVAENSRLLDVAGGTQVTLDEPVNTAELSPGGYACMLSIDVAGESKNLAQDSFQIKAPPLHVDAGINVGERGRLLVLLDQTNLGGEKQYSAGTPGDARFTACITRTIVDVERVYGRRLVAGARVDAELLDRNGVLHDGEIAYFDADPLPVNRGDGSNQVDLAIVRFDQKRVELTVGYDTSRKDCAERAFQLRLSLRQDGALLPVTDDDEATDAGLLTREIKLAADNDDDGDGVADRRQVPDMDIQRAHLEALLQSAGWSYTIVTNGEDFTRELRSGHYLSYALFSGHEKLSEQTQKELREAVYRGESLLVAGAHDERNGRLDEVLGIRYQGKLSDVTGISFDTSPLELTGQYGFAIPEKPERVTLEGAQMMARYLSDSHNNNGGQDNVAVAYHAYGEGESVFVGFDLLAQATVSGSHPVYDELLLKALMHIQPISLPLSVGGAVPLRVTLSNQGMDTVVRLFITLPPGAEPIEAMGLTIEPDGRLSSTFILLEQADVEFNFWMRLPLTVDPVSVDAVIQLAMAGTFVDYDSLSLPLSITGNALNQARTELDALGGNDFRKVRQEIAKADDYLAQGNIDKALQNLVQAAEILGGMADSNAVVIRKWVAAAIREVGLGVGGG